MFQETTSCHQQTLEALGSDHGGVLVEAGRPDGFPQRHDGDEAEGGGVGGVEESEGAEGLDDRAADEGGEGGDAVAEEEEGDGEGEQHGEHRPGEHGAGEGATRSKSRS